MNVHSVCFVMPNMSGGGAQRVVSILANELVHSGWDVSILLTNDTVIEYELDSHIVIDRSCAQTKQGASGQIRYIRKTMRAMPSTTFVSFLDNQNLFTVLAGIGMPNRTVISQRNDPHQAFSDRPYMRPIARWLYQYADHAVFQTKDAMAYYPKRGARKYSVILNPLNEALPQPYTGERSHRVVTVCRLNVQKNLYLALDAFAEFSRNHDDYVFEIYGKGELEEQLKAYAQQLGLSGKVQFKGFCSDVHTRIIDAAMFIITSDYEGLSNAMLESLAIGLPTIATDCPIGGARMVIKNGENGVLAPVGNRSALVHAMQTIADNQRIQQQLSSNGAKIRERLSIQHICDQWVDVLSGQRNSVER